MKIEIGLVWQKLIKCQLVQNTSINKVYRDTVYMCSHVTSNGHFLQKGKFSTFDIIYVLHLYPKFARHSWTDILFHLLV